MNQLHAKPSVFRRSLAAGLAGLVLVLGLLAVNPAAHAWLHDAHDEAPVHAHAPAPHDAGCVVLAFAQGISLALPVIVSPAPERAATVFTAPSRAELHLQPPRYLRQPERGPPAA